jgi:hypothetical protein
MEKIWPCEHGNEPLVPYNIGDSEQLTASPEDNIHTARRHTKKTRHVAKEEELDWLRLKIL